MTVINPDPSQIIRKGLLSFEDQPKPGREVGCRLENTVTCFGSFIK